MLSSVELELGRDGHQPPAIPLKVQIRAERRLERKQRQQPQQRQLAQYFQPKGKGKRGSASISNTSMDSVEPNQQLSKKQALGENSGSGTEELDRLIADDHNQIEEERTSTTIAGEDARHIASDSNMSETQRGKQSVFQSNGWQETKC